MDLMDIPPSKTIADVMAVVEQREARYRELITTASQGWRVNPRERRWLSAIFGHGGSGRRVRADAPLMSNLELRRYATRSFIDQMVAHWHARPGWRRYYSITFINEFGNSLDRAPQLNLDAFRRVVDKALRTSPLSAICVFELQAIMNYPRRGHGRALLLHCHAIGWTDDPAWTREPHTHAEAWAAKLNASRAWTSLLGADPVRIKLINATEADIATVAAYITKPPHDVKNRIPIAGTTRCLLQDELELEPDLALRLGEGLSQISFREATFSVCAKTEGNAWRKIVTDWHRGRLTPRTFQVGDRAEVAAQWGELRSEGRFGSAHFRTPFEFLTGEMRPAPIHVPAA